MYILGIETSCDETAAAVIKTGSRPEKMAVLSNIISSQIEIHKKYGGVVPEVAAREHVLNILPVINEALIKANVKPSQIDLLAVTKGPGLITSLITGLETVRTLAFAWQKPVLEINHIEGHIYSNFIKPTSSIKFPAIILTVSGGHTNLIRLDKNHKLKIIGETLDDAAGEAYDKGAKMLGLEYPGGPLLAREADKFKKTGRNSRLSFPRPMLHANNFDFSFSGLKTALLYQLQKDRSWKNRVPEYCFAYQQAIIDILIAKTLKAVKKFKAKTIMLSGGVSANQELKEQFMANIKTEGIKANFLFPEREYTTDNAAMIAAAAAFKRRTRPALDFDKLRVDPSLPLRAQ
jgi:N6-L-threonylcarbamoyladenine synthase